MMPFSISECHLVNWSMHSPQYLIRFPGESCWDEPADPCVTTAVATTGVEALVPSFLQSREGYHKNCAFPCLLYEPNSCTVQGSRDQSAFLSIYRHLQFVQLLCTFDCWVIFPPQQIWTLSLTWFGSGLRICSISCNIWSSITPQQHSVNSPSLILPIHQLKVIVINQIVTFTITHGLRNVSNFCYVTL